MSHNQSSTFNDAFINGCSSVGALGMMTRHRRRDTHRAYPVARNGATSTGWPLSAARYAETSLPASGSSAGPTASPVFPTACRPRIPAPADRNSPRSRRTESVFVGDHASPCDEGTMRRGASSRFRVTQGDAVVADEYRSPYDDYVESFYRLEREFVDGMLSENR